MKSTLQQTQIALMFQTIFSGSFDGILSSYQETYPTATGKKIPLPDDFPENSIPRLEINHPDTEIIIRFAKSRADIFFNSNPISEDIFSDFLNRVIDLGVTVGRIGYVRRTIYSEIDMQYVKEKLSMLEVVDNNQDILEAAQRLNKETAIEIDDTQLDCNNIVSLKFGKKDDQPTLLLERDVNTKQDKNLTLKSADDLQRIISLLKTEAEKTLFSM